MPIFFVKFDIYKQRNISNNIMNWRKINMKYIPIIGDVVLYGGGTTPKVVVDMKSNEDFGSCCYDREYLLCDESFIKNSNGMISNKEIEKHGIWVELRGMKIPDIRKCEDIAPYAIEPVQHYSFKQMKAKTVTVYELPDAIDYTDM